MKPNIVLDFWFNKLSEKQWWIKDPMLDLAIKKKFLSIHKKASIGELYSWRLTSKGRLAEIIVLDQFSRNIYRNLKEAYQFDHIALILSQELVSLGLDDELSDTEVSFAYLPFMHSESKLIHKKAVELYLSRKGLKKKLEYEYLHKKIIDKFGRYPHRNKILGRKTTPEEKKFLLNRNSSF